MEPNLERTQHACLGTRAAKPASGTEASASSGVKYYELREQVYLQGDARWQGGSRERASGLDSH